MTRDPLFFARRTTVLAYINTMFNLGLRHEAGVTGTQDMDEAMRYYRKAADLGNLPARARLKVKEHL
jgi:TPR repeat protein